MNEYHIGQTVVPYEIEWSQDRSTIGLSMDHSMELTIKAPHSATTEDIEQVLDDKKEWILKTLYGLSEQEDPPLNKEFLSGEKLLYNGRRYRLRVVEGKCLEPYVQFDDTQFLLSVPDAGDVSISRKRQAVVDWYYETADRELPERADDYVAKLGLENVDIDVRELPSRWGEYRSGDVVLNWRLILAPRKIQDYVVVHELAHFKHGDHSDSFWNTVGTVVPDYRERREWLRLNGSTLSV